MEDIDAFLADKGPIEAASISAVHLVHAIYLLQILDERDVRDAEDIILNKACASLPANIDRVYFRLADEGVWDDLCNANDYAVIVSEHVAENYAGAAVAIGLQFHRAILQVIDEDSYFESLASSSSDKPRAAIDVSKVKDHWDDVVAAIRKIPKVDTFLLRVQIKKEFQRTTKGKQLPKYNDQTPVAPVWSSAKSPAEWAKLFKLSWDTLKNRFDSGSIRVQKLSTKSYRVHVDDLPK